MPVKERDKNGKDGFCMNCGKVGLHPQTEVCEECDGIEEGTYRECEYHKCRNILGPVTAESNDKYCSSECNSKDI